MGSLFDKKEHFEVHTFCVILQVGWPAPTLNVTMRLGPKSMNEFTNRCFVVSKAFRITAHKSGLQGGVMDLGWEFNRFTCRDNLYASTFCNI